MKKYLIVGLTILGLLWAFSIFSATSRVMSLKYDDVAKKITPVIPGFDIRIPTETSGGVLQTDTITDVAGTGAPDFSLGLTASTSVIVGEASIPFLRILSNNEASGASSIHFADSGDPNIGKIDYQHTDNSMDFVTNNGTRMTITSTGGVSIGGTGGNGGNVPHRCNIVSNPVSAASGASASCAASEIVMGGGCLCSTSAVGIRVSYPSSATQWTCSTVNASNCGTLTAYSICCDY